MSRGLHAELDTLVMEVDMLVYRLERDPPEEKEARTLERRSLRRELERIKERLEDLAQKA